MTLTIGVITKEGIVLASDSQATAGFTSNDTVKKVFKLENHYAIGIAGDGSLAMHLINLIQSELDYTKGVNNLAEQFRSSLKKKYDDYFAHQKLEKRARLVILLGGYSKNNIPKIIFLNSEDNFVPRESTTGFECIGIPVIATYLFNRYYQKDISFKGAMLLSTFCIKETSSQDYSVGGATQIAKFSNKDSYSEISKEEIANLEKICEEFRPVLKGKFYPEE